MTDRELLEMAAKAMGYDTSHPMNKQRLELDPPVAALWITKGGELQHTGWNPIEDDADALRLAVKLRMDVDVLDNAPGDSNVWVSTQDYPEASSVESLGEDDCESVRRAIVRAAAELGKAMP